MNSMKIIKKEQYLLIFEENIKLFNLWDFVNLLSWYHL